MKAIDKKAFYKFIGNRNIIPKVGPYHIVWVDVDLRKIIGYTYPGWKDVDFDGKYKPNEDYFLETENKEAEI